MTVQVGILVFPEVQQLDMAGPYEFFATAQGVNVDLIWKNKEPVRSFTGITFPATKTFDECPDLDVICIPGGNGVGPLLTDEETLDFVRQKAKKARYVTSVCTGAMVLGAAGLLKGKRATTHWNFLDYLSAFGAIPVSQRIVTDGNVITAAGVSAGADFALWMLAETVGKDEAEKTQLWLEYAPKPPYHSGNIEDASQKTIRETQARWAGDRAGMDALFAKHGWERTVEPAF
ncbi:DJ-1/PfpI family protein [Mesorhizobium sp. CO1-1-8]|uniref:DJ-1/PfpI family protein n=1 Tax=Mesorhizobium sp. CO1-1-8 TaxID=2876631 RepID=UPI001CD12073|nr:DJ-1/PfpI family protein [Mesorhizobium sp. CO1-1-8]MBZ9772464.1 DJ-1/PfpI family protein [Mesorhizobium sp. CO1-1-8]